MRHLVIQMGDFKPHPLATFKGSSRGLIPELSFHKLQEGMNYSPLIVGDIPTTGQGKCAFLMEFCVKTVS